MKYVVESMPEYATRENFICLIQHEDGVWSYAGCYPTERRAKNWCNLPVKCHWGECAPRTYCKAEDVEAMKILPTITRNVLLSKHTR